MERNITVIPAKSRNQAKSNSAAVRKLRVAAYCRVSTDQEDQMHSFEAQVDYYTKYIGEHENYQLAGIYADGGISGTSTKKREQFKKMIQDCEQGRIDMVITKSISRFARNTQDCLMYSRKLKNLGIGIVFEKEHINTLDSTGELLFTILSSLAQDESRNISENCKWGIRSKFKNGEMHINTSTFLGYDKDEDGGLIINPEQAVTIERIYNEFLWGNNPQTIARGLEDDGIPGCMGQTKWYPSTVIGILKNEKHMGDALLQKTYTADFLTKKQVRNHGELTQYYVKESHTGIIDRERWNAVQQEFERREDFKKRHGLANYSYGVKINPFTCRVFCGKCGALYTRHSWKSRGIIQWQCKNYRKYNDKACDNAIIKQVDLEKAFVKAFNAFYEKKEAHLAKWNAIIGEGAELQRVKAKQMIELLGEPPLEKFVPEIAQFAITEITVHGGRWLEFEFVDGTKKKISL